MFLAILSLKIGTSTLVRMASSFFPDFGLMWYLEELKRDEFKKFKDLLRKEPLELGLKPLPWGEVKRATRENLAKLLTVNFEEEQAWNVTLSIFHKIGRKDLCEKAKKEITGEGVWACDMEQGFLRVRAVS